MNDEVEYLFVCLLNTLFLLTLQYLALCDQIIFLEDGKICEKGIHSELIQKKGRYAQLIQKMLGKATQVISTSPHPTLATHREEHLLHSWHVLSSQDKLQDTVETAEDPQGQGQAWTTFQEEILHENDGNGAGEQGENICLPACPEVLVFPPGPQMGPCPSLSRFLDITYTGYRSM